MGHYQALLVFCFLFKFCSGDISRDVNDLKFFYFPSDDQKVEIVFNDTQSLLDSEVKTSTKTVVLVDGFLSDSTSPMSTNTREAFIKNDGNKINLIVLDWGRLSGSGLTLGNPLVTLAAFNQASANVGPVGYRLAEFLQFVSRNKQIQAKDIVLIGHSLGAHIAGQAGRQFASLEGTKLSRVVGLDPAGPYVSLTSPKLRSGDALFVDIYHTNAGTLGDTMDLGDVNIYVNGGRSQPGCAQADVTGFAGYCSHSYSWMYYNAQFVKPAIACPCNLLFTPCSCSTCQYNCNNGIANGPNIDVSARGKFHVSYAAFN